MPPGYGVSSGMAAPQGEEERGMAEISMPAPSAVVLRADGLALDPMADLPFEAINTNKQAQNEDLED